MTNGSIMQPKIISVGISKDSMKQEKLITHVCVKRTYPGFPIHIFPYLLILRIPSSKTIGQHTMSNY